MKKLEIILLAVCSFLGGLVLGFLIAPIKRGLEIGNNCGNTTHYYYGNNENSNNGNGNNDNSNNQNKDELSA